MKHHFLFLLLCLPVLLPAQRLTFTVFAKSGLKIRKAPNQSGKQLGLIPFGSTFESDERDADFTEYICIKPTEVIEGRKGKWIKANYQGVSGYVFSGFCLRGENYFGEAEVTDVNYKFVDIGITCSVIKQDPRRYLYAIYSKSGKHYLTKTELNFKILPEFENADSLVEFESVNPIRYESSVNENIEFIISAKKPMVEGEIFVQYFHENKANEHPGSVFVHRKKSIKFEFADYSYEIYAFEKKIKGDSLTYQLGIKKRSPTGEVSTLNLSNLFYYWETYSTHKEFESPALFAAMDLNRDNLPDLVFGSREMSRTCSISSEDHLLISQPKSQFLKFESTSYSILCDF